MSVVKTNDLTPSEPGRGGLWLRLRRWAGTVAWGAYRGDNPGILIGAMLILIAIFATNAFPRMGLFISMASLFYALNLMGTFLGRLCLGDAADEALRAAVGAASAVLGLAGATGLAAPPGGRG